MRAAVTLCLVAGCSFDLKLPSATNDAAPDDGAADAVANDDAPTEIDAPLTDAPIDASLCAPQPPGLIAWWPGDTAAEIIGNRTSTLVNGAVAGATGKVGGAFDLDGTNDRVDIVDDVPALTEFTIEGWVDFDTSGNTSWRTVFGNDNAGPGMWMKDRKIDWYQSSNDRFTSSVTISTTGWHHFALVYGADDVFRAYVDGEAAGTATYAGAYLPQNATIGGYGGYELSGKIDELSIYDRALGVLEIGAIVTADQYGKCR